MHAYPFHGMRAVKHIPRIGRFLFLLQLVYLRPCDEGNEEQRHEYF